MKYTVNKKVWALVLVLVTLAFLLFLFLMFYPATSRFRVNSFLFGILPLVYCFFVTFKFKNESVQIYDDCFIWIDSNKKMKRINWADVEIVSFGGKTKLPVFGSMYVRSETEVKGVEWATISAIFGDYKKLWATIIEHSKRNNENCIVDLRFKEIKDKKTGDDLFYEGNTGDGSLS